TDAHVTLLVAEHLAAGQRQRRKDGAYTTQAPVMREHDIADFLHEAKGKYGRYWRKSAREPGAERELAAIAIDRLEKLHLAVRKVDMVHPLPALARFALGEAEACGARETRGATTTAADILFTST